MKVAKNFLVIFKKVMRLEKRVVDDDLALFISRYIKIGMGESRKIPEPIRDELVGILATIARSTIKTSKEQTSMDFILLKEWSNFIVGIIGQVNIKTSSGCPFEVDWRKF